MARLLYIAAILLMTLAVLGPTRAAGVNVVNPQRLPVADQERIISELVTGGVRSIRVPLAGTSEAPVDFGPAVAFVVRASKRGITTTLNVFPQGELSSRRQWDKRYPTLWGVIPLSKASPALTAAAVRGALSQFDREGVRLDGIEVGNEINYTAFNGDFPVPGKGAVYDLRDIQELPELRTVADGLRLYIDVVRAVRSERDRSARNRDTPIISAGLSDPGSKRRETGSVVDAITIPATFQFLRAQGLDDVVDAYGIHVYPGHGEFRGKVLERRVFGVCASTQSGKPCWLTEWGFKSTAITCPSNDIDRAKAVRAFARVIAGLRKTKAVARDFYYQWSGSDDPFGVFRCGSLTDAGRAIFPQQPR